MYACGGEGEGWMKDGGRLKQHAHRKRENKESERERKRKLTVLSRFSTDDFPGSYSKMLLGSARYFLVSTFLSRGSHSFLWEGGRRDVVDCGIEENQSLSSSLHGNLHRLRCFFNLQMMPHYPCSPSPSPTISHDNMTENPIHGLAKTVI